MNRSLVPHGERYLPVFVGRKRRIRGLWQLARQDKEDAKLSEQVRARLGVESSDNQLAVLLSVQKGDCPPFDWRAVLAEPQALPHFPPRLGGPSNILQLG